MTTLTKQPPKIVKQLSLTLHGILIHYLGDSQACQEEPVAKIRLALALALERGAFPDHLLYLDYRDSELKFFQFRKMHISYQAWAYADYLLSRPIQVVNKHSYGLTNMHKLWLELMRLSQDHRWQSSDLARNQQSPAAPILTELTHTRSATLDLDASNGQTLSLVEQLSARFARWQAFFAPLAKRIEQLLVLKRPHYSAISLKKQQQHGPYWLTVLSNAVEVPEQLNLDEVFEHLPVPLQLSTYPPSALTDTLSTLNAPYAYFRSLGMDPIDGLSHYDFSSEQLKTLKKLHRQIQQAMAQGLSRYQASYQVFTELKNGPPSKPQSLIQQVFAGQFDSFYRFYNPQMLDVEQLPAVSVSEPDELYEIEQPDSLDEDRHEQDLAHFDELDHNAFLQFRQQNPQHFNPLLSYAWTAILIEQRSPAVLLQDLVFQQLVAQNPAYQGRPDNQILSLLEQAFARLLAIMTEEQDTDE